MIGTVQGSLWPICVYQDHWENIERLLYNGLIGSILNPLAGKFSEDTRKKVKGRKQGYLTIGGGFICRNMIG